MPLPTFLIVGVPRAGTTSLAAYLAAHPDVFMAAGKELHYFNGRYDRGVEWYKEQFAGGPAALQRGEATPGYLFKAKAIELMARTVPDAKIVVVLREPVDRAYSHFWLNRWRGIEPLDFEAALRAEDSRLERRPDDPRRAYFGIGCYADQLRRLQGHYPAEQVHITFFEDLKRRPGEVVKELCRYLQIREIVPTVTGERHNHHGPVRSVQAAMLARKLPGPLCRSVRRLNTRSTEYPRIDPGTRTLLTARFDAANVDLPMLVGSPMPWPTTS